MWLYQQAWIGPAAARLPNDHYEPERELKTEMATTEQMWKAADREAHCANLSIIS